MDNKQLEKIERFINSIDSDPLNKNSAAIIVAAESKEETGKQEPQNNIPMNSGNCTNSTVGACDTNGGDCHNKNIACMKSSNAGSCVNSNGDKYLSGTK